MTETSPFGENYKVRSYVVDGDFLSAEIAKLNLVAVTTKGVQRILNKCTVFAARKSLRRINSFLALKINHYVTLIWKSQNFKWLSIRSSVSMKAEYCRMLTQNSFWFLPSCQFCTLGFFFKHLWWKQKRRNFTLWMCTSGSARKTPDIFLMLLWCNYRCCR